MATDDQLACTYGALILADDEIPITAEKLNTILKAANVQVEPIWPSLFARALSGINVRELITKVGSCAGPAAPAAAAVAAPAADAKKEEKKVEKKEEKKEEEEEEDEDMGFGLFD